MTAMDDNASVALYGDSLANFSAKFTAMQLTMKSQADSLIAMQNQLANIQLCMTVGQQPPSSSYAPAQQQCTFINHNKRNGGSQSKGRSFPKQPTMNYGSTGGIQQQVISPPTPYKHRENWNYCHSHGGDIDDNHTSATCGKPGPMHNPNASRTNIMGVGCRNAHDHLAIGFRLHSTQLLPPAAAALSATFAHCLLPTWRHSLAATNHSRTVWQNATGQRHLPPADNHGNAGVSAQTRNDDEYWTVPSECWKCVDDADGPSANSGAHVDEPLCPQPAAQQAAGVFLTSRSG
jgi:hypothetical protein